MCLSFGLALDWAVPRRDLHLQRQSSLPLTRQSKQRIAHGRGQRRHGRFAHAGRVAGAGHDVGFHNRGLAERDHGVARKIALLHHATHDVDLAEQRSAQRIDHAALHLLGHGVRVDHGAAVDGTNHAVHADLALFDRDLGHLRHDGAKGFVQRDAPRTACGQRLAPA